MNMTCFFLILKTVTNTAQSFQGYLKSDIETVLVLAEFDHVLHQPHVHPAQLPSDAGGPGGHGKEGVRGPGYAQKREVAECFPNSKFS